MDQPVSSEGLNKLADIRTGEKTSLSLPTSPTPTSPLTPAQYLLNLQNMNHSRDTSSGIDDVEIDHEETKESQDISGSYLDLRTGLCYDARMRFHVELVVDDLERNYHPEQPRRILAIYQLLGENGLIENCAYTPATGTVPRPLKRIQARYATKEECCRVHTQRHFDDLKETADTDDETLYKKALNGDSVYYNQATYTSALLAAGSAIETTMAVVKGEVKNAIAVIRPPGHHSEHDSSGGFCHFDNVAVAVRTTQHHHPEVRKVLIVDWDVHHGNGIQDAFKDDANVLYISLHVYANGKFYPSTSAGAIEQDGEGEGKGMNVNIGWESVGRTDGDYLMAFQHIVMPIANQFNPDLVMIASGFDAAEGDQLGHCHISPEGYSQMTHMLMSLANGKVVVCLEGGYNLKSISVSALAVTKTLMGQPPARVADAQPTASGAKTVFDVIQHHQQHWPILHPKTNTIEFEGIAVTTMMHDAMRFSQAEQLFKDHGMYQLPIARDPPTLNSKSFENQVLATHNFRNKEELLLVFHDQPEIVGASSPVTGEFSMSNAKILDSVTPFVDWGIKKGFAVIDVNLPDFYTGLSRNRGEHNLQHNKQILLQQLQTVSTRVWDDYVATSSARKVVILGIGNAWLAAQRIIATHSIEAFALQKIRAVGVVNGEVPGAYPEPHLPSYEYWWPLWTKVWVPSTNKIFHDMRNGRPKKKFGTVVASEYESMNDLLTIHERDIRSEILIHFGRPQETPTPESSEADRDGVDKVESDSPGPGKREREEDDGAPAAARVKLNEE